ncbi:MAG: lytic transglycosylase domain-containing protein [Alphaproteobacteria bacterium]|nr:lytic transglycosylase domain-containing protein [Alphaproteobacteria bacterium]
MDAIAFADLLNRCAPGAPHEPLTAIVRQASGFEPLLITIEGKKAIPVQAMSLEEGVQLASEATVSGQTIRIGLAQLDAEERKAAGLSISASFDPCKHVAALGALYQAHRLTPQPRTSNRTPAIARVAVEPPSKEARSSALADPRTDEPATTSSEKSIAEPPLEKERPNLDVYRSTRGASLFVYQR